MADIYNPKPLDSDLILPMPGGAKMVFRPVFIGEEDRPFSLKQYKMGDPGGGFKEYPTEVSIGGAFVATPPAGQPDWVYYIGKYEVTEAQYAAITAPGSRGESQEPICDISWFDAQDFTRNYNLWLFENASDKLPKNEDASGFLRLPTEAEWEFAARGGSAVDMNQFDMKLPYDGPLTRHEWFAGPSSSHGKKKKIGILEPNPLGIHDMLGNVAEMTHSFYRIEYYQGRVGGFVSRGGHSYTSEGSIRSSLREEIPFYKRISGKMVATRQPTLGFRLVISSPIYASRTTSEDLKHAWDDYVKTTRQPPTSRPIYKTLPLSARTDIRLADAMESLKRLVDTLNAIPDAPSEAFEQLGLLNASFQNIESLVKNAEHDSAFAWVKVASETAYLIAAREMKELPGKRKALEIATNMGKTGLIEDISKQIRDKEQNIKEGLNSYGFAFMQLEKISEESVNKGFERYRSFLLRRNASEQIKMSQLVDQHYKAYMASRRLNAEKWEADLMDF